MDWRARQIPVLVGVAVGVMGVAFGVGYWLTSPRAPGVLGGGGGEVPRVAATAVATGPAVEVVVAATPEAIESMMMQLLAAQASLQQAADLMQKATIANKGGYVEKSRTDLEQALSDLAGAIDFARAHPEVAAQRPPAVVGAFPTEPPPQGAGAGGVPNLRKAMAALTVAYEAFNGSRGGELGGYRAKVNGDLKRAGEDIVAGIRFNRG